MGALGFAVLVAPAAPAQAQVGYDRQGSDYLSFTVHLADPAICAARCEHDGRCRAWSFSYPHTRKVLATCRLMRRVPPRQADDCCVSGVRGAGVVEPRHNGIEYGIDRIGGDYRNFDTASDPAGAPCQEACTAEKRCRDWTYMRPGYAGASARCYLKSKITRPRHKPCCISGVVR
ncbi:MAG: PAN domain-containing protein [Stellaceae bacterium]